MTTPTTILAPAPVDGKRPRDGKLGDVLAAERAFVDQHAGEVFVTDFRLLSDSNYTLSQGRSFDARVAHMLRSRMWRSQWPSITRIQSNFTGQCASCSHTAVINNGYALVVSLDYQHDHQLRLLHQVAHSLNLFEHGHTVALHGPQWAKMYLKLVKRYVGNDEAKELKAFFLERKVKTYAHDPANKEKRAFARKGEDLLALLTSDLAPPDFDA